MSAIVTIRKGIDSADRIADAIANPDPSKPFSNAIGNAGRKMCDGWSSVEPWTDGFIGGALPGPLAGSALLNAVCKPYLDSQGYSPPELVPPYTGGQCAQRYSVTSRWNVNGVPQGNSVVRLVGPLGATRVIEDGPISRFQMFSQGTHSFVVGQLCGTINNTTPDFRDLAVISAGGTLTPEIVSISPCPNEVDDCGDPPGEFGPGDNPAPSPGPFPPGEEPGVDPDGNPFFFVPPISDPFGDVDIPDDPFGEAPGAGSGGDGLPGDPAAIGEEAGEVTGGEDGEDIDFGEPPEGRVWIGCIVETSSIGKIGNIAGTGPGSTVWPTVRANAALNYGSKKGTSYRINSKFHDLIRPATSLIVTGVFLQVLPGSTSKVFPLSALICPSNPCEEE